MLSMTNAGFTAYPEPGSASTPDAIVPYTVCARNVTVLLMRPTGYVANVFALSEIDAGDLSVNSVSDCTASTTPSRYTVAFPTRTCALPARTEMKFVSVPSAVALPDVIVTVPV